MAQRYATRETPATKVWAVVKANAYGHGLLRAAAALGEVADGFALLDIEEAVSLRDAGIRQPILLLEGFFEVADMAACAEYELRMVVQCREQLQMIRNCCGYFFILITILRV